MITPIERGTDSVAVAAVASPFWLPALQQFSEVAGLLLPVAGLVWLLVQIFGYVWKRGKK